MKFSLSFLRTLLVSTLLILLGSVVQYRYNLVERLPFKLISQQQRAARDVDPSTISNLLNPQPVDEEFENLDFNVFWQAWKMLEEYYVEPEKIETSKMIDGAVGGMTASIGDPYTMYLPREDKIRTGEDLAGAFFGVGIELGYVEGVLAVIAPLSGTPAERAGIQPGDLILNIKDEQKSVDESTNNMAITHAVDLIRGPRNSSITLTMFRKNNGNEPFDVTLQREEIIVKSVELNFVEESGKRAAHIKLSKFGERTMDEWDVAVQQILQQRGSIDGVVLDMRNNPGGFFDDAIEISSDFIPSGVVVSQKGRTEDKSFKVSGNARLKGIPLVVLVNGGSASASEIVAGALRDQLGTKLVGQKTFGKGTVQDRRELTNGGALHITIARWMMPGGEWIHDEGIPVAVEVQDNQETEQDEMLQTAIQNL
ncbi:MAG: carboxyl-terminal processing protease [Patescibacteria group bacterium]|nr:carboxyl-terminal processing protease [Patescibacteria group bacterium]